MIQSYTQIAQAQQWLQHYRHKQPLFACILGFTETALIPGISAAGATPDSRQFTAIADAEFLVNGRTEKVRYPLPPLTQGVSPVFISRAVLQGQNIPIWLFDAGLPIPPSVPAIALRGRPARCVSTGKALDSDVVQSLFQQGWQWGETLAAIAQGGYLILSECVVAGTTTALAVLTGLGFDAHGKVNSSHSHCNHNQKWSLVTQGLAQLPQNADPWSVVAAVGDPMQVAVAGMLLAASDRCGVLLAGGTQMLAVYALARAIATHESITWNPEQVVVGTTRWVAEDPTADTVGLANAIGEVALIATQLSFRDAQYPQLQVYEQGFVKEGVGAGGCAIAAHLFQGWNQSQTVQTIEQLIADTQKLAPTQWPSSTQKTAIALELK
jgi:uncharacterized protein (TIGR00303 family)